MKRLTFALIMVLPLFWGCFPQIPTVKNSSPTSSQLGVKSIKIIDKKGGRLGVSPDGKTIAYDKKASDGYYDVWTMNTNGRNKKCLSCDINELPKRNVGQPAWHPSGDYLVVQVEKQEHHDGIAS